MVIVDKNYLMLVCILFIFYSVCLSLQIDFSRNSIRFLRDGVFEGLEDRLQELSLHHNLLGDIFEPVFGSTEIAKLTALTVTIE